MGRKIEMTEAARKSLEGYAPFGVDEAYEFTPSVYLRMKEKENPTDADEFEVPKEYQPVFKIRAFTIQERSETTRFLANMEKNSTEEVSERARKILVGWKNLIDIGKSEEIEFAADKDGFCTPELFGLIPDHVKAALLMKAILISGVSNREKLGLG